MVQFGAHRLRSAGGGAPAGTPGRQAKGDKVRVLLTNDDGVRAAGLLAIRAALTQWCSSVVTVAPAGDCSGFARQCTFGRPVEVRRLEGGQHPVYECDGTPGDCVRVGLLGGLAGDAGLVVSGINHGANLADDVAYSGTVGAGLEAALLGTSALCLSQQMPADVFRAHPGDVSHGGKSGGRIPDPDFSVASRHGAALAASIGQARLTEPVAASVNYPAAAARVGSGPPSAVRLTRPGRRIYPRASVRDWDSGSDALRLYLFGEPDEMIPAADDGPDTDIEALRAGCISVTPLSLALGLDELTPAVTALLAPRLDGAPGSGQRELGAGA
jgi:5'-nucleotidase